MGNDTIIAPATPPGVGGLSVLRLSGPIAFESLSSVSKRPVEYFPPRVATLTPIFNMFLFFGRGWAGQGWDPGPNLPGPTNFCQIRT